MPEDAPLLDPWDVEDVDYARLEEEFGIERIDDEILSLLPSRFPLMERGIVFGHRDLDKFLKEHAEGGKVSVLSGMMPSGRMHLGHKTVVDQLVWYQREMGLKVYIPIADLEAHHARGMPLEEAHRIAVEEYVLNYAALGLDLSPDRCEIYLQSERKPVQRMALLLAGRVTWNTLKGTYGFTGETNMGHAMAPLVQAADILHPQELEGPHRVLVPVGVDQDPHLRLTRDLAEKEGLVKPASTYHRFMTGLTGGKMSSSKPSTAIFLTDDPEEAKRKVWRAKTGGGATVEEHREKGGNPDECVVYELFVYHLADKVGGEKGLREIRERCESGDLICGECKKMAQEALAELLEEIAERRERAKDEIPSVLEEHPDAPDAPEDW
ncbi:MAG: tryptophan--tRNA ligase [Methanopyri archaeon]|nr:tryptophan--tRNA ligase [Methanopyri archaeon]